MADPTNTFVVRKLLDGLRRQGSKSDSRAPITVPLRRKLLLVLDKVCASMYESKMYKAAFPLVFGAFLRVGEFTAHAKNRPYERRLSLSDVQLSPVGDVLRLHIRFSKTDQFGAGTTVLLASSGSDICPVSAVEDYLASRSALQSTQFFCHFDGSPLTRYQFSAVVKKAIDFLGIATDKFKSHSFRIGAAEHAAAQGMDEEIIKTLGSLSSNCYQRYIRMPLNI